MTDPKSPASRPSPWAVALLVFSAAFALVTLALVSTGYTPF
ncbi:hypothetical protein [uncultured Phenylobacterium sp.]|nr:hypothetical protein [uncultured Phenylobacterium sp.]